MLEYCVIHRITYAEEIIMTISLRLSESDRMLFKKYAEMHRLTMSELIRQAVLEKIEDEYDLQTYQEAIEEFKSNPVTYTHEEVWKELDL